MQFHYGSVLRWKKFTQGLLYVVCTQARKHVHKRITKRRYGEKEPGHFVFGKPVLFTLGLGLTTPDSLGILFWNFYQTFVIVSIEFWLRFEPQIRPTRLETNFLRFRVFFRHCQGWKEGSFVCGNVWFFLSVNIHPFDLKFDAFCPKFRGDSWVEFQEKTIPGEFFKNFMQTKAILYRNLWNSALNSAISFWVRIALKEIHTSTFVCCLHPGKEARP